MTWWLIPSLIGVILIGIITGILISRQVVKSRKKDLSIFHQPINLPEGTSAKGISYQVPPQSENFPKANQQFESKPVSHLSEEDRLKTYINMQKKSSAVKIPPNPALKELHNNLLIANKSLRNHTNNLASFKTEIWNTRRSEFEVISTELMAELSEAYVDMMLANNIAWLVKELGRGSEELNDSYINLANKIAERLQRIMPEVRDSFKQLTDENKIPEGTAKADS
jgi:hypothetical protein